MKQEIKNQIRLVTTASIIKDGFDYISLAKMALKKYSVEIANDYFKLAKASYRTAKRRIEN